MLRGDNLAWLRLELGTDLATPRAVFEALVLPRCLLNGRNVLPRLVVARTVSMMHYIEDPKLRFPRGIQDLQHMRNAVIRFCNSPNAAPYLASLGNVVVIGIDHQKCSDFLLICVSRHGVSFGALASSWLAACRASDRDELCFLCAAPVAAARQQDSRSSRLSRLPRPGSAHLTSVTSGLPFSTTYVPSSAAFTLPTFFAAWIVPAGMNKTSPA